MTEVSNHQTAKKTDESLAKIAISKDADRSLTEVLSKVNDGFDAGRVNKQELASHIILQYGKECSENEVRAIRAKFFDPILLMEATLRRAKATGVIPEQLRNLLYDQFAENQSLHPGAKKSKKPLNANIIKDNALPTEEKQ